MFTQPAEELSEEGMLAALRAIADTSIESVSADSRDQLSILEQQRQAAIAEARSQRQNRNALKSLVRDAQGFNDAVSSQNAKLGLASHMELSGSTCPVCNQESSVGGEIAREIDASLALISAEVASISQSAPELIGQLEKAEGAVADANQLLRETERQIREVIQQNSELQKARDLSQARAMLVGRIEQFLETTAEDFKGVPINFEGLIQAIEELRELVDPSALEARLSNATNLVSNYASEMVASLPTTEPLTESRIQFSGKGDVKIMEAGSGRPLDMVSVGSDQNYQGIHLSLYFALHKHFAFATSPVPGIIVIDQISRPYFPSDDDDERPIEERRTDEERLALKRIVDFIFNETANAEGLQVLLI